MITGQENTLQIDGVDLDLSIMGLEIGEDYFVHRQKQGVVISKKRDLEGHDCIGGFRYGASVYDKIAPGVRRKHPGVLNEKIIYPMSVWDTKNRPKCDPTGMVKVGGFWADIDSTNMPVPKMELGEVEENLAYDWADYAQNEHILFTKQQFEQMPMN